MAQTVFNRYEKKYLMSEEIYFKLRDRLAPYMKMDQYGLHTICNIYYDTKDYDLIRRSIEKPVYKEKLRLRSYGIPSLESTVFLEIKKKYNKVVNKRRIPLSLKDAYDYVEHGIHPENHSQIIHEIDFFLQRYELYRSVYLAYDRIALFQKDQPDFRVTFDQNIRSRQVDMGLEKGDRGTYLLPDGYYLMESKIMGATPLWFTHILSDLEIYPVSFSKYGNIYKSKFDRFHPKEFMIHRMENWNEMGRKEIC